MFLYLLVGLSRAVMVSVIGSVFLERTINQNQAPSARVGNQFPSARGSQGFPV